MRTDTIEETEHYISNKLDTIRQIDNNEVPYPRQNFTDIILRYLERLSGKGLIANVECTLELIAEFNKVNKPIFKRTDLSKYVEIAKNH